MNNYAIISVQIMDHHLEQIHKYNRVSIRFILISSKIAFCYFSIWYGVGQYGYLNIAACFRKSFKKGLKEIGTPIL